MIGPAFRISLIAVGGLLAFCIFTVVMMAALVGAVGRAAVECVNEWRAITGSMISDTAHWCRDEIEQMRANWIGERPVLGSVSLAEADGGSAFYPIPSATPFAVRQDRARIAKGDEGGAMGAIAG